MQTRGFWRRFVVPTLLYFPQISGSVLHDSGGVLVLVLFLLAVCPGVLIFAKVMVMAVVLRSIGLIGKPLKHSLLMGLHRYSRFLSIAERISPRAEFVNLVYFQVDRLQQRCARSLVGSVTSVRSH